MGNTAEKAGSKTTLMQDPKPRAFGSVEELITAILGGPVEHKGSRFYVNGSKVQVPANYFCGNCSLDTGKPIIEGHPHINTPEQSYSDTGEFYGPEGTQVVKSTVECGVCGGTIEEKEDVPRPGP